MATPRTLFVRVCPFDPRRGYTARTFVRDGERITAQWREMPATRIAQLRLKDALQENNIQPMFQICTREEALQLEALDLDRNKTSVLSATRAGRIKSLNKTSAAVEAELAKQQAAKTSDETKAVLADLQAGLDSAEEAADETQGEPAAKTPPPAPKPRRRKRE